MRAHVIDLRPEFATSAKIFPSSSSLRFSLATDTLPSWMSLNSRSNLFKRKPLFVISVLALEASMAQGYKSDASHCANPDIAGEDVPTSIKNLVSDILKVRWPGQLMSACRGRFLEFAQEMSNKRIARYISVYK